MNRITLVLGGIFMTYYSWKFLKDPLYIENYVLNPANALIFKKVFGIEKAIIVTKRLVMVPAVLGPLIILFTVFGF